MRAVIAESPVHGTIRFLRTPKGIVLAFLVLFVAIAVARNNGDALVAVITAVTAAGLLDAAILRASSGQWQFPDGAIITGLIVAMVLRSQEPISTIAACSILAVLSKQLLRVKRAKIFNPAAFGLIAVGLFLSGRESWWGALPDMGVAGIVLVLVAGFFVANHINKLPLVLTFLGAFCGLATLQSLLGHSTTVAELFRTPDLQASLFFALFMLDDPPTCPIHYEDQVVFGAICALVSFVVFTAFGPDYFLVAGLLVANAWESLRRLVVTSPSFRLHPSGRLSFFAIGLAALIASFVPLGAEGSVRPAAADAARASAATQPAVVTPIAPVPTAVSPSLERRRGNDGDARDEGDRRATVFSGTSTGDAWELSSPQMPGEVLEIRSSGLAQLLARETRDVDFTGSVYSNQAQGRGQLRIELDGKGVSAGVHETLVGTYEINGGQMRFTARVSRSAAER